MHLTGVKEKTSAAKTDRHLSAVDFYNKCLAHKLSPNDFDFSKDGTTHLKLEVLPTILCKNLTAKMIGTYNSSKPYLYTDKIAGSTKACIGFVVDSNNSCYVPNTLLKDNILNNLHSYVQVIAVFRKDICDPKYSELTYRAKNTNMSAVKLPKELSYLSSFIQ